MLNTNAYRSSAFLRLRQWLGNGQGNLVDAGVEGPGADEAAEEGDDGEDHRQHPFPPPHLAGNGS